jgi:uncharacterized protein DUF3861
VPAYRITVDALDVDTFDPVTGEEGLQSLSFFASTSHDILAAVSSLRTRGDLSACTAAKLGVAISLLSESRHERRDDALFTPLQQAAIELLRSLEPVAVEAAT